MVAAKPDCTGRRFGLLTAIGRGKVIRKQRIKNGKPTIASRKTWLLRCDCGNTIELVRSDFDKPNGQRSCGCLGKNRKGDSRYGRKAADFAGKEFGELTAIERIPGKFQGNKPIWLCRCNCGAMVERSTQQLRAGYAQGRNCGDRMKHPDWGFWYPPTPSPYPQEAAAIVAKYLHLANPLYEQIDQEVQDARLDRLLRAAWILTYRRSRGEEFSPLREKRFIRKHVRYCGVTVYWRRRIAAGGGVAFTMDGKQKQIKIGGEMTDLTSSNEAVAQAETQPEVSLPIRRRIKFKRC